MLFIKKILPVLMLCAFYSSSECFLDNITSSDVRLYSSIPIVVGSAFILHGLTCELEEGNAFDSFLHKVGAVFSGVIIFSVGAVIFVCSADDIIRNIHDY